MSMNSREELNNYYQYFNNLVDDYTDKWKIRPSNLKRYLQPGSERFNKFLEKSKTQVKQKWGVEINDAYGRLVLQNVLDDRYNMEKDGILTFESYKVFESDDFKLKSMKDCLYKGIEKSTLKMEKILADYFDTNLSDIDVEDSEKHLFKINGWNQKGLSVVIYSEEEVDIIRENISSHLVEELLGKRVVLTDGLNIDLKDIIDNKSCEDKVKSQLTEDYCIGVIGELTEHKYKDTSKSHHIWVM